MKSLRHNLPFLLWSVLSALPAGAYTPPVDTTGPLTVRIEGPELVTQVQTPTAIRVVLQSNAGAILQGTVRLQLADRWRAEPAGPVAFSVGATASVMKHFQITAGPGTYSAHYPVHAYVTFTENGKTFQAHPILIFQTKLPDQPQPVEPISWKPLSMPNPGQLALWSVPVRRSIVRVFNQPPLVIPVGWQGSEPRSGASLQVGPQTAAGQTRDSISMHPPWMDGRVGTELVEFPVILPKASPLALQFANAMQPTGHSDGVTFRVRVLPFGAAPGELGEVAFQRHTVEKAWQPGRAELARWAGQTVRLQLESHPGPKNDTGWDQSYWAEPTLVAGVIPAASPFPPANQAGSKVLGKVRCGGVQYEVRAWPGRRGLWDTAVGFVGGGSSLFFRGFQARVFQSRLDDLRSPYVLFEAKQEKSPSGLCMRHRFQGPQGSFDVLGRLWVEQEMLHARFALEDAPAPRPWQAARLEDVAAGPWSSEALEVYAGHGNVIRKPGAFSLGFDGHRLATSFVGFQFSGGPAIVQAVDVPPEGLDVRPAERHYSLRAPHDPTLTFVPGPTVWEAVKLWHAGNGLKAAGGVRRAAGRFVFDLWGGRYAESADRLRQAFRYGLTDAMVIFHDWQRWGYDYRLPNIYPPSPQMGTLDEMQGLMRTCRAADVPVALHDNYIDFYPDADGFSYQRQITFHSPGHPVQAWLNESRQAQSYRFRADAIEPFLKANLKLVKAGLGPTAYFIDVWSSASPYDYWTADGRFFSRVYTRDTWGRLFGWIRDYLGGDAPQISESGHDQLVGWLDGGQTNHLRVGKAAKGDLGWCVWDIPCQDAERIPWHGAGHHDRFVLHGAGYPGRYEAGLDPRVHGIYSDDYMATEVLDGHPAMASQAFSRDVVRKYWLLGGLGRALALHTIDGVEFAGGDLHRQHVRWSGGGETWVNRAAGDWSVGEACLPEYGFLARASTPHGPVETAIRRRQGLIVEESRWPDGLYVNGRQPVDGPRPIRLSMDRLHLVSGRQFEMAMTWQAESPIPAGWYPFLHFVDEAGEIIFQPSHVPGRFDQERRGTFSVTARGHVPTDCRPGQSLELRYGIYNQQSGDRLPLAGSNDGDNRIRLGSIRLEGQADKLSGLAWTAHKPEPDPLLKRLNVEGRLIDFGPLVTAGGCRITREGSGLLVTPLPQSGGPKFTARIRWSALPWNLPEPTQMQAVTLDGKRPAPQPVRRDGQFLLVEAGPEVFSVFVWR